LPAAVDGNDRGLHQARVATRRLREAVPVLTSGVKGTKAAKARRKIRRLTRALGTVRELDVTLHILDELAQTQRVPRPALEDVRMHVLTERDERRGKMLERLHKVDPAKLGRRLSCVAEALRRGDNDGWRDALAARLGRRADTLRDAMADAGQIFAPDRLHRVRIAAKKLRYALEIAADSAVRAALPLVRTLKRSQNTLGRLHDLQVLLTHVAAVQTAAAGRRSMPNEGLETLARVLEEECRHLHGRYLSAVPGLTEVCELTRECIVPHLAERRRARRPVKMTLRDGAVRRRVAGAAR
jgi:CHAD domain-containing protein